MSPGQGRRAEQHSDLEQSSSVVDQQEFQPETFRLDGKCVVSTSAPSETLYTLNHNILDKISKRTAPILITRTEAFLGVKVPLYNLTYGRPDPDSKSECYLAANDKLGATSGNIALQATPRSTTGPCKTKLHAQLSLGRFWYHRDKFSKQPRRLVVMKESASGYDYCELESMVWPIAREQVSQHGEKQLKILFTHSQQQRDILIAIWCLSQWRRTRRARQRVRRGCSAAQKGRFL